MRKYRWSLILILAISLYSVFATSAGQAFSLGTVISEQRQAAVKNEYIKEDIAEKKDRVTWLDKQISSIDTMIAGTVTDLRDSAIWKTALSTAEEKKEKYLAERKNLSAEIARQREKLTTHTAIKTRSENIYEFYGEMFGIKKTWLQFALQTILSVFIAIMAPLGIIVIQGEQRRENPIAKSSKTKKEKIKKWVKLNWIGIRSGKSKKILPRNVYIEYLAGRGEPFNRDEYKHIYETAKKTGVIAEDDRIIEKNEATALEKILGGQQDGKDK